MTRLRITINIDGVVGDENSVRIPVLDRGFLYGDSVYEVLRTYGGKLFAVADHLERLKHSADRIELSLPPSRYLHEKLCETISASGNDESWCRLIVTRGVGPLTLDPLTAMVPTVVVIVKPFAPFDESTFRNGVRLWIPEIRRASGQSAIKSGNYLSAVMAMAEARRAGFDDALLLNERGCITEATTSNVFIAKNGVLKTPSLEEGLLSGVTRRHLIALLAARGTVVRECAIAPQELFEADEIMLTSTVREVQPVVQINEHVIADGRPGPLAVQFRQWFHAFATSALDGPIAL